MSLYYFYLILIKLTIVSPILIKYPPNGLVFWGMLQLNLKCFLKAKLLNAWSPFGSIFLGVGLSWNFGRWGLGGGSRTLEAVIVFKLSQGVCSSLPLLSGQPWSEGIPTLPLSWCPDQAQRSMKHGQDFETMIYIKEVFSPLSSFLQASCSQRQEGDCREATSI